MKLHCPFQDPNLSGGDAEQCPADPRVGLHRDPHSNPNQLQRRRHPAIGVGRGPRPEGPLQLASRRRGLRNVGEGPGAGGARGGGHEHLVGGGAEVGGGERHAEVGEWGR